MSDLPTLIVEGDPAHWIKGYLPRVGAKVSGQHDPLVRCDAVRIDGPLPTLYLSDKQGPTRPLRVGDRVTLAMKCVVCVGHGEVFASRDVERTELDRWYRCPACHGTGAVPFATATVDKIDPEYDEEWLVTVTDVEGL